MSNKAEKWKELSREVVFQKYGRKIEKVVYVLPDGREGDFYLKKEGPAVCTLALTRDKNVILAKQFRPGPDKILLEMPGGGIEKGENPEQAAERELLEETGFKGKIELIAEVFDCAYSTMNRYCAVATDCEKVSEQRLEENEFAEIVLMPLNEFRELLRSGKMTDVEVGYLGLDHLGLL
jgi:ADP-ribose pyrophosphatase